MVHIVTIKQVESYIPRKEETKWWRPQIKFTTENGIYSM